MRGFFKIAGCLTIFCVFSFTVFGQSKLELEKQKSENIGKLEYSKQLLEQTTANKQSTLNQLNLIQKGIVYRSSIIENLVDENKLTINEITRINQDIEGNEKRIERLKSEYAELVKRSYRNLDSELPLMYILSAEDMNQSYQRLKYLKFINQYRKETIEQINSLNDSLIKTESILNVKKIEQQKTIDQIKEEQSRLDNDKKEHKKVVSDLMKKESSLMDEIRKREEVQKKIELEIKKILEEEARKARNSKSIGRMSPEERLISDEFGQNIGRLPWPTPKGIIVGKFGEHAHPVLKGIKIMSNGIDIATTKNSEVRAVFRGTVTKVIAILGSNYTIIIKHGDFWTVYQNIVDVNVKAGDEVRVKQPIGIVYTDSDNVTKLHFEIWKERDVLDPALWLSH